MNELAASDTSHTPGWPSRSLSAAPTPLSTASSAQAQSGTIPATALRTADHDASMDDDSAAQATPATDRHQSEEPAVEANTPQIESAKDAKPSPSKKKKSKCTHKKKSKKLSKPSGKPTKHHSSSDDSSSLSDDSDKSSSDSDTSETSSDDEKHRKKRKAKKLKAAAKKAKTKKSRKHRKTISGSDSDDSDSSDSSSESSSDDEPKRKKTSKRSKKVQSSDSEEEDASESGDGKSLSELQAQLDSLKLQIAGKSSLKVRSRRLSTIAAEKTSKSKRKSAAKKTKEDGLQFKRVDHLWDSSIHNWKIKESAEDDDNEFAEYAFLVRRCFDWENKYSRTEVDIKSKQLRSVLAEIMKDCKSVSLEAEEPVVDPNTLFLYLESLRTHYKKTLKASIKVEKKRKVIKKLEKQRSLCKTLVKYLDADYADTKKTLYPLLAAGNITFELLWALYRPNEIAVTSCYGAWEEPRCFRMDYAIKNSSMMRGEWYAVEGKYLEYDGKNFGMGAFEANVEGFKGPRKITSLSCYPLKYHKDAEGVKKQIIERGRQFLALEGMNYRFHKGLAFHKKKKQVIKICVNGRVMVDPATFRRINPNYPISFIKPHEDDELSDEDDDSDDCSCCGDSDDEQDQGRGLDSLLQADHGEPRTKIKYTEKPDGTLHAESVEVDEDGCMIRPNTVQDELTLEASGRRRTFTDDELLLTSPVVYGFAFNEKLWLEFTISGIRDIEYNDAAFDSLVLPTNQKSIVRALVESHKFHAAKTIDDVVQGKGKGLVSVLHGPPGTGKTLTAEGISELLRCPLYMVSAGELGTDPAKLEFELQKILDIAHSWGAVLLLDEADVFLEKREVHDIHRNALVSIFLRLLEYFQGILFLTTNRVETFDDAFQSRIHVALRYGDLTTKAKRSVWTMFIEMCRAQKGCEVAVFSDKDLDALSRHQLNGRQIKNIVRTAQALALNEGAVLGLSHVKKVMEVAESFERDLKGGSGYTDAMRSYT